MKHSQISTALASLAGYSLVEGIETMHRLGFPSIGLLAAANSRHSIGPLAGFFWNDLDRQEKQALRQQLEGFEIIAVHAPFVDLPLNSYCPHVRALAREMVRASIEATAYLGAKTVTIHLQTPHYVSLIDGWDDLLAVARDLGDYAALLGVTIGVETGFPPDPDDFVQLIQAIAHPAVGATVDIGHVTIASTRPWAGTPEGVTRANDNIVAMIHGLGDRLVHTHIHDVRYTDWRDHRELGTGIHDMPRIIAALDDIGYEGALEFELEEEDRQGALLRSKAILEELVGTERT